MIHSALIRRYIVLVASAVTTLQVTTGDGLVALLWASTGEMHDLPQRPSAIGQVRERILPDMRYLIRCL